MDPKRKRWLMIGVGIGGAVLVIAAVLIRPSYDPPERKRPPRAVRAPEQGEPDWRERPIITVAQPKPDFKPANPIDLGKALDTAAIKDLIDNLRVASETDDDTTMRALIDGLRRRGTAAKALVEREMAQLPGDSKAYFAMKQVLR